MPLTDKLSVITQALVDKIKANAVTLGIPDVPGAASPGADPSVFYGDQVMIPVTPTVCVDPVTRQRDLSETGYQTTVDLSLFVIIYHGKVQDIQDNLKECLQFSEAVEALLHSDKQLGGLVVSGYVAVVDMGITVRGRSLMRASRLTWRGLSKSLI
jgi:hypothetical protein